MDACPTACKYRSSVFIALLFLGFTGCRSASEATNFVNVSGTVTLDGQPVAGAKVLFVPIKLRGNDGNYLPPSWAVADGQGRYQLTLLNDDPNTAAQPGAVVGKHRVWITTWQKPNRPERSKSTAGGDQESAPDNQPPPSAVVERAEEIPIRYNGRTELVYEVPERGTDQADFALTSE